MDPLLGNARKGYNLGGKVKYLTQEVQKDP